MVAWMQPEGRCCADGMGGVSVGDGGEGGGDGGYDAVSRIVAGEVYSVEIVADAGMEWLVVLWLVARLISRPPQLSISMNSQRRTNGR